MITALTVVNILMRLSCIAAGYTIWRTVWEDDNLCLPGEEMKPFVKIFFIAIAVLTAAAGATLGF